MELRLAFIGFGNVARAFARILNDRQKRLEQEYGLHWKTTAIATRSHGCIMSTEGIDLLEAAACVQQRGSLTSVARSVAAPDPVSVAKRCDANILFETSPLNVTDGEPAVTYIREALTRGISVITANKGPVAFAYSELKRLAAQHGASFRFEGTVMDGAPVFNLFEKCLPGTRVLSFCGVLNSTTNLILTDMESGRTFDESLAEAQRRGIAEADPSHDIDGWDAVVKAVALANVLMNADARPGDVARKGIRDISSEELVRASRSGQVVRLVARGTRAEEEVRLTVSPEMLPAASVLGSVRGTSNALIIETDLMGELAVVETDPGVDQTAYALVSDMIAIHQNGAAP